MNTVEPVSLKELIVTDFRALMSFRVRKILMICSNYDAFILEEDGQIESQIYKEYLELNLSNPPQFVWVTTSAEAETIMASDDNIDMIICLYNDRDRNVFRFTKTLKENGRDIPFILLTHFSREIYKRLEKQDTSSVDYIFSWNGNADLIVAIIKLFEDKINADNDILKVGVESILLVEDSVRYYSTYLPELYRLVLKQSAEFLKETLNEKQRKLRKRSRPRESSRMPSPTAAGRWTCTIRADFMRRRQTYTMRRRRPMPFPIGAFIPRTSIICSLRGEISVPHTLRFLQRASWERAPCSDRRWERRVLWHTSMMQPRVKQGRMFGRSSSSFLKTTAFCCAHAERAC